MYLNQCDIANNRNKFYIIQLLESDDGTKQYPTWCPPPPSSGRVLRLQVVGHVAYACRPARMPAARHALEASAPQL